MSSGSKVLNRQVNGHSTYKRAAPIFHREEHKMHMLVAAPDYRRTGRHLTSMADARRNIEELARQSGVQWIVPLYDEDCTRQALLDSARQMGSQCGPDDYFLFYFAGHGTTVPSAATGAEEEAFVCVDKAGRVSKETLLPNSELCAALLGACHAETRIIFITDCSHNGTIVDIGASGWAGRQAALIAGCHDIQRTEDTGRVGIFTHCLLLAIDKLSKVGRDNYSVGMLHNAILNEDELVFACSQDIGIQTAPGLSTDAIAWPLVPPVGYQAPLSRCAGPGGVISSAPMLGVSAELLQHVRQESLNVPVSIEEYVALVQGSSMITFKPCRGCATGCSGGQCTVQ